MDEKWKLVQTKTFTKWMNTKLEKSVNNIFTELCDGIILRDLLISLSADAANILVSNPAVTRFQKVENVNNVLEYINSKNIKLVNIGSVDVVDGNEKLILGLLWIIILRFSIFKSGTEFVRNDKLLNWCKLVTAKYDNVNITDFSKSWQDGLGFNALIHKFKPELIDYKNLDKEKRYENLRNAFDTAEKELGIAKIIDPEDICDALRPDEKSIMTYVSLYYDRLHDYKSKDVRKIDKELIDIAGRKEHLREDYNIMVDNYNKGFKLLNENYIYALRLMKKLNKLYHQNEAAVEDLFYKRLYLLSLLGTLLTMEKMYGDIHFANKNTSNSPNKSISDSSSINRTNSSSSIKENSKNNLLNTQFSSLCNNKSWMDILSDNSIDSNNIDLLKLDIINKIKYCSLCLSNVEQQINQGNIMDIQTMNINVLDSMSEKSSIHESYIKDKSSSKDSQNLEQNEHSYKSLLKNLELRSIIENVLCNDDKIELQIRNLEKLDVLIKNNRIKQIIEHKLETFAFICSKKETRKLIEEGVEMFHLIDTKKQGKICIEDVNCIFNLLGLPIKSLPNTSADKMITVDEFVHEIKNQYDKLFNEILIQNELEAAKSMNLNIEIN
ncbi:hypothetical protein EDEG_01899 [Edhazardia aedis USNM 41457]|uniref:Calponin-homology (CH) domain-containing protein n=1 Tax=Edhazardia aedis (strain USNM 41457) TaxID=1003232 RepID=J9DR41_EDHAE|nr:hypothetical protein EDEG_01899 [Edhazardia aedis USNM 41457]|eukprot:EJW03807.1 hypothetical protein EDEG_01899 [Edhazardia aedis USNM 41457]